MTNTATANSNLYNERNLNPIPVQVFAHDIVTLHADPTVIQLMLDSAERLMYSSGLDIKPSKCAVLYATRSRNNWYKGKREVQPNIYVQGNCLESFDRNVTYKYLGKTLALSGEDSLQVIEMIDTYSDLVHKIQKCNLQLALKGSAFNNLALGKILHHFYNTRLTEEQLEKLDNLLTSAVFDLYGLYKSTTSLVIYLPREHGGIGVKRISDVCSHLDTKT